jgi:tRNA threonylcarbamoyl adenosine modification protein YjeE
MKDSWALPTVAATEQLGVALALNCPWDGLEARVLYLSGELGAGKTTLAAALLQALGVGEVVRSPSYALVELYQTPAGQAAHIDLYRLQGESELEPLGLRDYLNARTLMLIEWPERAPGALPRPDLHVYLQTVPTRLGTIEAHSSAGVAWLSATFRTLHSPAYSG